MEPNPYGLAYHDVEADAKARLAERAFVTKVFGWMTAGLMITAVIATYVAGNPALVERIFRSGVFVALIIAELGLVLILSAAINKLSAPAASAMFIIYSALNGLTLSVIFLVYTTASLTSTFFITSGTFGAMFLYGWTTKRDLTGLGSLCFMALIGLILASIVNLFMASSGLYWLVTYAGVAIFVGLTAYDGQKIRLMGRALGAEGEVARKAAVLGALALYLDFVNLFLLLLRIFGRRR